MIIFGLRWITWGREQYRRQPSHCTRCGQATRFRVRTRMRFIHIFWIPLIPVSGKKQVYECANCKATYDMVG